MNIRKIVSPRKSSRYFLLGRQRRQGPSMVEYGSSVMYLGSFLGSKTLNLRTIKEEVKVFNRRDFEVFVCPYGYFLNYSLMYLS